MLISVDEYERIEEDESSMYPWNGGDNGNEVDDDLTICAADSLSSNSSIFL